MDIFNNYTACLVINFAKKILLIYRKTRHTFSKKLKKVLIIFSNFFCNLSQKIKKMLKIKIDIDNIEPQKINVSTTKYEKKNT